MSEPSSTLTALVPKTPQLLAYTIPLLIVSLPLTFAGTFLTLDRSRSFPESSAPVPLPGALDSPKKSLKIKFPLEGGVGGLASGYVFGVHSATFLSLLTPAISSSADLSANSFLAVWILSCILTTILGGRYRYCARAFAAVTGGSLLALAISLATHPPLLPRQILTGLLAVLSLLATMIFTLPSLSSFLRPTLRIMTTSSGAFSLILAIALLSHTSPWANVWERLWLRNGEGWGTSKEKGLSAAYFILFGVGIAADYALNRWLGECPDEKWDHFLARYSANLPNAADRAGSFRPLPVNSLWGRLFGSSASMKRKDEGLPLSLSMEHPRNSMAKDPALLLPDDDYEKDFAKPYLFSHDDSYDDFPASPIFLQNKSHNAKLKPHRTKRGLGKAVSRKKKPIKFGQELSSDSSDDDSYASPHRDIQPWLMKKASTNSSSLTLTEQPANTPPVPKVAIGHSTPPYWDYEEDIGARKVHSGTDEGDSEWRPGFIKRHLSSSELSGAGGLSASSSRSVPMGAVPATPSLIKALDRVSAAQRDAYGTIGVPFTAPSSLPSGSFPTKTVAGEVNDLPNAQEVETGLDNDRYEKVNKRKEQPSPRWEEFWREVKQKSRS